MTNHCRRTSRRPTRKRAPACQYTLRSHPVRAPLPILVLFVALFCVALLPGQNRLNDFDRVLPQVAKGGSDPSIETTLQVINPNEEAVSIDLTSTDEELLPSTSFELGPMATKTIILSGGELRKGSIRIHCTKPLSVSALMVTKQEGEILSQLSLPAEPLEAGAVIPVLYRSDQVENTGLAVFFTRAWRIPSQPL